MQSPIFPEKCCLLKKWPKMTVSIISQNGLKVKVIFFSDILHEVKGT